MKRINFKKALLILVIITIISGLFAAVIIYLNKEPQTQEEVQLPTPDNIVSDKYADSLVERQDEQDRTNEFNYDISVSVSSSKKVNEEYSWVTLNHEKITLNDNTSFYLNNELVQRNYTIKEINNGILRIETYDGSYILEIKKLNSEPYNRVVGVDNYNEENDVINQYDKIKEEYYTIYSNNSDKTALEYGGIGTYSKMINFINSNNLKKDIGLYTSSQVKQIIEKAFSITIDDNFGTIDIFKLKDGDLISNRIEKRQELSYKEDYMNIESYYLIGDGTNIYACHLDYDLYIPSQTNFEEEVLFYFTNSIQLY